MSGELPTREPFNREVVQRLHDTLAQAVELEQTFEAQHRLPVHVSSCLRRDEAVGNAASGFKSASVATVGALDHLITWHQIVAADLRRFPLPIFSHYTLARAAYESALLTLWLLDPEVDSAERIGRGYARRVAPPAADSALTPHRIAHRDSLPIQPEGGAARPGAESPRPRRAEKKT